jgi:hypothetical protein
MKHLQTNFLRFLIEKYDAEIRDLKTEIQDQSEETNEPDEKLIDEIDSIQNPIKDSPDAKQNVEPDNEIVESLIREYIKRKHK